MNKNIKFPSSKDTSTQIRYLKPSTVGKYIERFQTGGKVKPHQEQRNWISNWYNDPTTKQRMGQDSTRVSSMEDRTQNIPVYMTDNPNRSDYYPAGKGSIYLQPGNNKSAMVHELTHATEYIPSNLPLASDTSVYRTPEQTNTLMGGEEKKWQKYIRQPGEIYSRLNQIRYDLKVNPGDTIKPEDIKKIDNTSGVKELKTIFKNAKTLSKVLNTVASIQHKQSGFQGGGKVLPKDYSRFLEYNKTAPENRRPDSAWEYGNPRQYDHYNFWKKNLLAPKDFEEAKANYKKQYNEEWVPNKYDGMYHGLSSSPDGVFLKSHIPGEKEPGNTAWMEYAPFQLSVDSEWNPNKMSVIYDPELQRLKYVDKPKFQNGGFLGTTNRGRSYSPAWGGSFQNGGTTLPSVTISGISPRQQAYNDSLNSYNWMVNELHKWDDRVGKNKGLYKEQKLAIPETKNIIGEELFNQIKGKVGPTGSIDFSEPWMSGTDTQVEGLPYRKTILTYAKPVHNPSSGIVNPLQPQDTQLQNTQQSINPRSVPNGFTEPHPSYPQVKIQYSQSGKPMNMINSNGDTMPYGDGIPSREFAFPKKKNGGWLSKYEQDEEIPLGTGYGLSKKSVGLDQLNKYRKP